MTAPSPTRRSSRIFIRKMLGFDSWRELEREMRRRRPIDTAGVEVCDAADEAESAANEKDER